METEYLLYLPSGPAYDTYNGRRVYLGIRPACYVMTTDKAERDEAMRDGWTDVSDSRRHWRSYEAERYAEACLP